MEDRDLAQRKIQLAEKELEFKHEELLLRREESRTKSTLLSPLGVAAIGGVLSLLTGLASNLIQGCSHASIQRLEHEATAHLEQQKQQSELILKAIDTGGDNDKARENLQFFVEAGLIQDNGKLARLVERAQAGKAIIPSVSSTSAQTSQEIRYFIEAVPMIRGSDTTELIAKALAAWQRVARIPGKRVESREAANVVIVQAKDGLSLSYAFVGPPTQNSELEISLSHEFDWTPRQFQAAVCREFGHILGLTNSPTPNQLLSADATIDSLPLEPQEEDITRVRAIWASGSPKK